MIKNIDGYLLTWSIKRTFILKARPFFISPNDAHAWLTKPSKLEFHPSLQILHIGTNDLSLEEIPKAIFQWAIATVESLKKTIMTRPFQTL